MPHVKGVVLGFQVPIDFNGTQNTVIGKCLSTTNVVFQLDDKGFGVLALPNVMHSDGGCVICKW